MPQRGTADGLRLCSCGARPGRGRARARHAIRVAAGVVLVAWSATAAAAPLVGPEFEMTAPSYGAADSPRNPRIASSGSDYLVVYERFEGGGGTPWDSGWDIYATRLALDGSILDPAGIVVCGRAELESDPAVAYDGTNYLVAWIDRPGGKRQVFGTRIARDGTVLEPDGIALSALGDEYGPSAPAVAGDGTGTLVVWSQWQAGSKGVYGAYVEASGVVRDPGVVAIASGVAAASPSVAWSGDQYLVAWVDGRNGGYDVFGTRVTAAGVALEPEGSAITSGRHVYAPPVVASLGGDFLVGWLDVGATESDVFAARVTAAGVVLDPSGLQVAAGPMSRTELAGAAGASDYSLVWEEYTGGVSSTVAVARVAADGTTVPASQLLPPGVTSRRTPRLAFGGAELFGIWEVSGDVSHPQIGIHGARIAADGSLVPPGEQLVSSMTNSQAQPGAIATPAGYLVTWFEEHGPTVYQARAARIGLDHVIKDPDGILLPELRNT
jgi:hypothetical protein